LLRISVIDPEADHRKLLLSLPEYLSKEFERPSIEAIRKCARTFDSQCATQQTGCALQARFLYKVAIQYEAVKKRRRAPVAVARPKEQPIETPTNTVHAADPRLDEELLMSTKDLVPDATHIGEPPGMDTSPYLADFNAWSPSGGYEAELEHWTFENNEKWEEMFATAGYRIHDGVFMPDDSMDANLEHA
jgi:hypothetical protein